MIFEILQVFQNVTVMGWEGIEEGKARITPCLMITIFVKYNTAFNTIEANVY